MLKAAMGVSFPALSASPARMAPSSSMASYASVAAGRAASLAGDVGGYLGMVVDPHSKERGARYPDETIVPTGMVHLATSVTYTVPAGESTFATQLKWKCDQDGLPGAPADLPPIILPKPVPAPGTWVDYGVPQTSWASLSAVDRTLACGIRVRLIGLPVATFLPAGTLYFIQLQASEVPMASEAAAIQAVTAGKGFSVTVNELSKSDGVTIPFLPQGPMSFVFSDTNSFAAVEAGIPGSLIPAGVVAANGSVIVLGFGMQPGQELRVDYAHHIEYIPRVEAAGLIATSVCPPSSMARDAISRGAQLVQQSLAGATSFSKVAGLVSEFAPSILSSLGRAATGLIPGGAFLARGAAAMAKGFGAPAWLSSALESIA